MLDWNWISPHSLDGFDGPRTVWACYSTVLPKALPYTAVFICAWVLLRLAFQVLGVCPDSQSARRGTWALKGAMLLHHALVTPLAILAIFEDPVSRRMFACMGCPEAAIGMDREPGALPLAARVLTPITLGYFIGDLLLLSQWNLTKSGAFENGLMLFHHLASLLVWPAAIYFDWVARYVLIMLSYEFTSFWLTVIWMLSAADMKGSILYVLAGATFTFSFVIMRMVGAVPQLVAMYNAPPWSQVLENAAEPGGIHPWCWFFCYSLVLPHLLNVFWGFKVVSGFLAVMSKKGAGGRKKKDKSK